MLLTTRGMTQTAISRLTRFTSVNPYAGLFAPSLAPPGLELGLGLGIGLAPAAPVISTSPHVPVPASPSIVTAPAPAVPVLVTAPYEPILAPPVIVTAPYEPISTTPPPASAYAESNALDRTDKSFHAREQAVHDQERKLLLETQRYETLNREATLRDLRAAHAEKNRLRDIEIAHLQEQNKAAANVSQPRQTRFDSHKPTHHHQRASTVPPAPATYH